MDTQAHNGKKRKANEIFEEFLNDENVKKQFTKVNENLHLCRVCNTKVTTDHRNLKIHMNSEKHKRILLASPTSRPYIQVLNPRPSDEYAVKRAKIESKSLKEIAEQHDGIEIIFKNGLQVIHCKLCNVNLSSKQILEIHVASKKHQNNKPILNGHTTNEFWKDTHKLFTASRFNLEL